MSAKLNKDLTIVIPAKNEEHFIGRLLDSLLAQDYSHIKRTHIVVADAASVDNTRRVIKSYSERLCISIVEGGLPPVGRNAGARLAKSRYILFLDADIELKNKALISNVLKKMKRKRLDCATTNIWARDGGTLDNVFYGMGNVAQYLSRYMLPYASGMFMMFDRGKFEELGGFNEAHLYAEDYRLTKKVKRKKFGIINKGHIVTSNRRCKKTGYATIAKRHIESIFHSFDDDYYSDAKHLSYWED